MPPSDIQAAPLDERKFEQDTAEKKRELDLKEREVAAREREVTATETELRRSRWLNPTVIGLFVAAIGLIGSVVVARVNNRNTQEVEHARSQSNLVLEAIKTGNPDEACKNLLFFVGLGLLDDTGQTIQTQCESAPKGAPSLPVDLGAPLNSLSLRVSVVDEAGKPLEGARVRIQFNGRIIAEARTPANGELNMTIGMRVESIAVQVDREGYVPYRTDIAQPTSTALTVRLLKIH